MSLLSQISPRSKREENAAQRFASMHSRKTQPPGLEVDPYGNQYKVYPDQHGQLVYTKADTDTILFVPEFYALVTDFEYGGLPIDDRLLEIGVVHIRSGKQIGQIQIFVGPDHVLRREDMIVAGADPKTIFPLPSPKHAVNLLARCLDETIPVACFDHVNTLSSLSLDYRDGQRCTNLKYMDTLELALALNPQLYWRTLSSACQDIGINYGGAPVAVTRASFVAKLYLRQRGLLWEAMRKNPTLSKAYAAPKTPVPLIEPEGYYLGRRGSVLDVPKWEPEALEYYGRAYASGALNLGQLWRYAILLRRNVGVKAELPIVQDAITKAKQAGDSFQLAEFQHRLEYIQKHMR